MGTPAVGPGHPRSNGAIRGAGGTRHPVLVQPRVRAAPHPGVPQARHVAAGPGAWAGRARGGGVRRLLHHRARADLFGGAGPDAPRDTGHETSQNGRHRVGHRRRVGVLARGGLSRRRGGLRRAAGLRGAAAEHRPGRRDPPGALPRPARRPRHARVHHPDADGHDTPPAVCVDAKPALPQLERIPPAGRRTRRGRRLCRRDGLRARPHRVRARLQKGASPARAARQLCQPSHLLEGLARRPKRNHSRPAPYGLHLPVGDGPVLHHHEPAAPGHPAERMAAPMGPRPPYSGRQGWHRRRAPGQHRQRLRRRPHSLGQRPQFLERLHHRRGGVPGLPLSGAIAA